MTTVGDLSRTHFLIVCNTDNYLAVNMHYPSRKWMDDSDAGNISPLQFQRVGPPPRFQWAGLPLPKALVEELQPRAEEAILPPRNGPKLGQDYPEDRTLS